MKTKSNNKKKTMTPEDALQWLKDHRSILKIKRIEPDIGMPANTMYRVFNGAQMSDEALGRWHTILQIMRLNYQDSIETFLMAWEHLFSLRAIEKQAGMTEKYLSNYINKNQPLNEYNRDALEKYLHKLFC